VYDILCAILHQRMTVTKTVNTPLTFDSLPKWAAAGDGVVQAGVHVYERKGTLITHSILNQIVYLFIDFLTRKLSS